MLTLGSGSLQSAFVVSCEGPLEHPDGHLGYYSATISCTFLCDTKLCIFIDSSSNRSKAVSHLDCSKCYNSSKHVLLLQLNDKRYYRDVKEWSTRTCKINYLNLFWRQGDPWICNDSQTQ